MNTNEPGSVAEMPYQTNWQFFQRQLETSILPIALEATIQRARLAAKPSGVLTADQIGFACNTTDPCDGWQAVADNLNAQLQAPPWKMIVAGDPASLPKEGDKDGNGAVLVLFPLGSVRYESWEIVTKLSKAIAWMPVPPRPR